MNFDAWRSAFGGAWQQLWLYPSGLILLGLATLLFLVERVKRQQKIVIPTRFVLWALVCPVVASAFLPLPNVGEIRAPLDLLSWWLLLELPLLLAIGCAWHSNPDAQLWSAHAISAAMVAWPLGGVVLSLLGWLNRSVLLETLKTPFAWPWLVGIVWGIMLIPWLLIGPWAAPLAGWWGWALRLRQAGHVLGWSLLIYTNLALELAWDPRFIYALVVLIILGGLICLTRFTHAHHIVVWGRGIWLIAGLACVWFLWLSVSRYSLR